MADSDRPRPFPFLAALALAGLASCGSLGSSEGPGPENDPGSELIGAEIQLDTRAEALEIRALEVARSTGGGRLQSFLSDPDPRLRLDAVRALGRLPFPRYGDEVTVPLCESLADREPAIRSASAFALGIRGDVGARGVLTAAISDSDARVRAKVVEALTRLQGPEAIETALRALDDTSAAVRQEAIVGLARWTREDARADDIDARLIALLSPQRTEPLPDSERWLVLYALQRRRSPGGAAAFLDHHLPRFGSNNDERRQNVNARLFAVRGLARLSELEDGNGAVSRERRVRALERSLEDVDWRIAVEAAVGLGAYSDPSSIQPLTAQADHESAHVRRAVLQALGSFAGASNAVRDALSRGLSDASAAVRAETLVSITRVLPASDALLTLQQLRSDSDGVVRAGVARAARVGYLSSTAALELLEPLLRDSRSFVAMEAINSLGARGADGDAGADQRLRRVLAEESDLVLVQVAAAGLGERATADDLDQLAARLSTATGDAVGELVDTGLTIAANVGGDGAIAFARGALDDPNPFLRERARATLEGLGVTDVEVAERAEAAPAEVPVPGRDHTRWQTNPIVAIDTNRGSMYFELYADDAPLHVHNLLELADSGYYDGTRFHRVELDFVIQGGDVRGDGAGGSSWRGDALGHEFSTRKYLRGSLGMPRWADPDSGGAQIFVTHRPTPHLDGRYTLFGQLVVGWEVLDSIEPGDRIRGIRLFE